MQWTLCIGRNSFVYVIHFCTCITNVLCITGVSISTVYNNSVEGWANLYSQPLLQRPVKAYRTSNFACEIKPEGFMFHACITFGKSLCIVANKGGGSWQVVHIL